MSDAERESQALAKRRKIQAFSKPPLRIGLLGCGAINSKVAEMIVAGQAGPAELTAVLVRKERSPEETTSFLPKKNEVEVITDADAFFQADWNLCVEAAGQPAVRDYAKRCLELGRDFLITSIGSLTDDSLYSELQSTAEKHDSRLILCTGSMPAVDWLGSAALAGDDNEVQVTQTKPPQAWLGTPAELEHPDLLELSKVRILFEGSARMAATKFPKNANVCAMLALATVGLDKTQAKLIADPRATVNSTTLSLEGPAGRIFVDVEAAPSPTNPRTSAIVALSVVKAIKKLCCPVIVGL